MSDITTVLKKHGLLDAEEYLVPPQNRNVMRLVNKIVKYRTIIGEGKTLTPEEKLDLTEMETAKDYYDDALEEELKNLEGEEDEDQDEDEADEYETDDGGSDEGEAEVEGEVIIGNPGGEEEEDEDGSDSYKP
jgi:hypothetical protein